MAQCMQRYAQRLIAAICLHRKKTKPENAGTSFNAVARLPVAAKSRRSGAGGVAGPLRSSMSKAPLTGIRQSMSVTRNILMHMFGRPRGLLGRFGGVIMARMNEDCGAWVTDLLEVGPNDSV